MTRWVSSGGFFKKNWLMKFDALLDRFYCKSKAENN